MTPRTALASFTLLALLACAPASSSPDGGPEVGSASGTVLLHSGSGVQVVDLSGARPSFSEERAVVSPDHRSIYSYRVDEEGTLLRQLDLEGRQLSAARLDDKLAARVVSGSGRLVALAPSTSSTTGLWEPEPRANTTIVVADAETATQQSYQLEGNFEPEAFSVDDRRLYTIEYIPALAPTHYRVRILQLATGEVSPIGRLKLQAPGQMRGTGRMQVYAPQGEVLYTLYTRQGPNYAHGNAAAQTSGNTHAFVHVLNLKYGWAHCVDLPQPFGSGDATASAITISPDGHRLFVSDWTNGAVAVVDPRKLKVSESRSVTLGGADDETFAATDGDTLYVAGNDAVVTVDADTLQRRRSWTLPGEIEGLALSPDGKEIFVALADRVLVLDAANGSVLDTLPNAGVDGLLALS